jgi:trehalose 6-phosphate phosphatase
MKQERVNEQLSGRDGFPSISPPPTSAGHSVLPPGFTDEQTQTLQRALSQHPRGLLLDIDGTLSPIAPTPEAARLLPGVAALLERAQARFEVVAAISGRGAADARRMVGVPGLLYIGNHGLERWLPGEDAPQVVPQARPYLAAIAQALDQAEKDLSTQLPGVRVERKGASGSIHTRGCAQPQQALQTTLETMRPIIEGLGLRLTQGRMIAEVRPPLALDKGTAVEGLVRERGLRSALYMGDDVTDIDAFRALRRLRAEGVCAGLSVAVLHEEAVPALAAEADFTLPSIEAVPAFLAWLIEHEDAAGV